jgi:preprotein translocase subunit YajC
MPCGRPVVELPFVTAINILSALIAIVIIYIIIKSRSKKSRKKHRHVFK